MCERNIPLQQDSRRDGVSLPTPGHLCQKTGPRTDILEQFHRPHDVKSELLNFVSVLQYRFIVHSQECVATPLYRVNEQLLVLLIREGLQQVSHAASLERRKMSHLAVA